MLLLLLFFLPVCSASFAVIQKAHILKYTHTRTIIGMPLFSPHLNPCPKVTEIKSNKNNKNLFYTFLFHFY